MCSFKHVSMCVSVCLNVSLGACWGACVCVCVCSCLCMWIDALDYSQWPPSVPSPRRPITPRHNILWANCSWSQTCYLSNYPECFGAARQAGQAHALWHTAWGEGESGTVFFWHFYACVYVLGQEGGWWRYTNGKSRGGGYLMYAFAATVWLSTTKWTKTCLATISITKTQCTADCGKEGTGARLCQLTVF